MIKDYSSLVKKNQGCGAEEVVQWVKNRPEDLHSDP